MLRGAILATNARLGLISRDPAQDDFNLYRYVKNNPINRDDPSGLQDEVQDELPDFENLTESQFTTATKSAVAEKVVMSRPIMGAGPVAGGGQLTRGYAVPFQTSSGNEYIAVFRKDSIVAPYASARDRYSIVGVVPGEFDPKAAIEVLLEGKISESNASTAAAALEFGLHLTPTGAAIDYANQGEGWQAFFSGAGDAALGAGAIAKLGFLSVRAARSIAAGAAATEATLGVYRTSEGIVLLSKGEGGYGEIAEGLLRLVGARVTLRSVTTPKKLPTKPQHPDVANYPKSPYSRPLTSSTEPGEYVFVQDADGVIHVAPQAPHAHPTVLGGGKPAAASGEIVTDTSGVVTEINNISYTFQHNASVLNGIKTALEKLGLKVAADAIKPFEF